MGRCSSKCEDSQRRERDRRKRIRRERVRRERAKEERVREERVSRKKMQVGEKVEKIAKHRVLQMFWGSGGLKSRLAKAAGAEPFGRMRNQKLKAAVVRKRMSKPQCQKHLKVGALLKVDVWAKVRTTVARSAFGRQNVKHKKVDAPVA